MSCEGPRTVHTIGHSTRAIETFLELLKTHRIELLVDVRRWPTSRRFPHFGRDALTTALAGEGIGYAWRVGAFRAYADFMLTPAFDRIMDEVRELAAAKRAAVMCAEAVPWRCHRQLLADALLVRGWSVRHILDDGCEEHRLPPFARQAGTSIVYPVEACLLG